MRRFALTSSVIFALGLAGCDATVSEEGLDLERDANTSAGCNATICPMGCCDANGICYAGSTDRMCGVGGEACKACGQGESCLNVSVDYYDHNNTQGRTAGLHRTCATTAAVQSCSDGCVMPDGSCHWGFGQYAEACGIGGEACDSCGTGEACYASSLGNGYVTRSCKTSKGPRWRITVLDLKVGKVDEQGQVWDANAAPDPYVEVSVAASGARGRTQTILESFTPMFNAAVLTDYEASILEHSISIAAYDDDPGAKDQYIASCGTLISKSDLERGWKVFDFSAVKNSYMGPNVFQAIITIGFTRL